MTFGTTIWPFLWYSGHLSVLYQIAVADQMGPLFFKCIPPMCWCDTTGSGNIVDERLAKYLLTPDTAVLIDSMNLTEPRNGTIIVWGEKCRARLTSLVLGTTMFRVSEDTLRRYIRDPDDRDCGYMIVERPASDPKSSFGNLGQDPLLANTPESLRSAVDPAVLIPPSNESCHGVLSECLVSVASVDVFYFGPEPTNTACLSSITSPPPLPTPPQVVMSPSSVYVVYQPPQIFDQRRNMLVGIDGPPVTMSYLPNMMCTLQFRPDGPPATKVMDFADLPSPPSHVAEIYEPGAPYFPILVSTFGARWSLFSEEDGAAEIPAPCAIAAIRDPPIHARRVGKISGRKGGGGRIP